MSSHEVDEPLNPDREEVNPLTSIIYNKEKRSNQPNQSNQIKRSNCSFHMLPQVAQGFRTYAKFTGNKVGVCVEEALIEHMRNNPIDQVTLNVTKDMRSVLPTLADKLKLKIIKNNLSDYLELMKRLHQIGNESKIKEHLPKFQKVIEKALRFKKGDKELTELLRQSEEYL